MSRRAQGARLGRRFPGGAAPAFLPTSIAGNLWWLRPDLGVTLNVTTVSQWNDQSGIGDANKNVVQGLAGLQPLWNASDAGYNGKPTLTCDNVDDALPGVGSWASVVPAVATWFVVGETTAANSAWYFQDVAGGYQMWRSANGGNHDINFFQGVTLTATFSGAANTKHLFCLEANGASSKIYRDSLTAAVTGNTGANTALNMGVVGAGGKMGGVFAEIILYSGVLSVANRTTVTNYLASRYGVTLV